MLNRRILCCVGAVMLLGHLAASEYGDVIQEAEKRIRTQYTGLACEAELSSLKDIIAAPGPESEKIRKIRSRFLADSAADKMEKDMKQAHSEISGKMEDDMKQAHRKAAQQWNDLAKKVMERLNKK